jgi:hypothetical protein
LRDEVLFNFGRHDADIKRGFVGSLGPDVPLSFDNQFDLVVTNPPWTRLRASALDAEDKAKQRALTADINLEFTQITGSALASRGLEDLSRTYTNPDNNPDLPILWRATRWAEATAVIAMALPGRIILRQSGQGKAARDAIFRGPDNYRNCEWL